MSRQEIQHRIIELDREINTEFEKVKDSSPAVNSASFPRAEWVLGFVAIAWYVFGGYLPGQVLEIYQNTAQYVMWAGAVLLGIAILRSFVWLAKRPRSRDRKSIQPSLRVRQLQDERRALQAKLKELDNA